MPRRNKDGTSFGINLLARKTSGDKIIGHMSNWYVSANDDESKRQVYIVDAQSREIHFSDSDGRCFKKVIISKDGQIQTQPQLSKLAAEFQSTWFVMPVRCEKGFRPIIKQEARIKQETRKVSSGFFSSQPCNNRSQAQIEMGLSDQSSYKQSNGRFGQTSSGTGGLPGWAGPPRTMPGHNRQKTDSLGTTYPVSPLLLQGGTSSYQQPSQQYLAYPPKRRRTDNTAVAPTSKPHKLNTLRQHNSSMQSPQQGQFGQSVLSNSPTHNPMITSEQPSTCFFVSPLETKRLGRQIDKGCPPPPPPPPPPEFT